MEKPKRIYIVRYCVPSGSFIDRIYYDERAAQCRCNLLNDNVSTWKKLLVQALKPYRVCSYRVRTV